jgi:hypothetical protein
LFIGKFDSTDWENSVVPNETDLTDWENSVVSCETAERPEPKKLTAADIPEGYGWAAVDKNGDAYAFFEKPTALRCVWVVNEFVEQNAFFIGEDFDASNWQESLVSCETPEQWKPKKLTSADIPDGFSYAAVNENGSGYAFKTRPLLSGLFWAGGCEIDGYEFLGGFDSSDWENSLVCRETIEPKTAYKETANKLSYSEIDPYFLEQMARRMQKGKEKYGPNNWKKLSDINELLDAAQRHLLELRKMVQEDFEPLPGQESEAQHCAALACNAMFIHYHLNPNT